MFDGIVALLTKWGASGVFLLMLAENVFPPIPSEVVLPLAGYVAVKGQGSLALTIAAGTAGSAGGATFWYYIGRWVGIERLKRFAARHGRWLTLTPREIDHVDSWFDRHGGTAVLLGRMVPGVRTLISVPAGVTGMKLTPFLAYTILGSAFWTSLLTIAGFELGENYGQVARIVEPASNIVLGGAVLGYLWRVATFNPEK